MSTPKKGKRKTVAAPPSALVPGKVVSLDKIALAARSYNRESIYKPVFERMLGLKAGEAFTVPVPKGTTVRTLQNRMSAAKRRLKIQAAPGNQFFLGTSASVPPELVVGCRKK